MIELSETIYRLTIREFEDKESASERAWIVDVMDTDGSLIIESAGVASTLMLAMKEAGEVITQHLASEWLMARAEL